MKMPVYVDDNTSIAMNIPDNVKGLEVKVILSDDREPFRDVLFVNDSKDYEIIVRKKANR